MADTARGNFEDLICSDCGERGCFFQHWGDLVTEGRIGDFCWFCWNERQKRILRGEAPKPLGVKPPGIPEKFLGKALMVTTKSGSVYILDLTECPQERIICCEQRDISFRRVRVLLLELGQNLWLRNLDDSNVWWTSLVISIVWKRQVRI